MTAALLAMASAAPPQPNPAGAVADLLSEMVRNSPFIPPAGAVSVGQAAPGELQLRGVVWDGQSYRFSIFDASTGESVWTGLDESGYPFRARSFDRERDALTVEYQGRVLVLTLAEAQLQESAGGEAMQQMPTPLPGPQGAPGNGLRGVPGDSVSGAAAQDAQRLQEMADETRRRRGVGPAPEPRRGDASGGPPLPMPAPANSPGGPVPMPAPQNLGNGPVPQPAPGNPYGPRPGTPRN